MLVVLGAQHMQRVGKANLLRSRNRMRRSSVGRSLSTSCWSVRSLVRLFFTSCLHVSRPHQSWKDENKEILGGTASNHGLAV